jgi:hypothetical protein
MNQIKPLFKCFFVWKKGHGLLKFGRGLCLCFFGHCHDLDRQTVQVHCQVDTGYYAEGIVKMSEVKMAPPGLPMETDSPEMIQSLSRWFKCLCFVTFDLDVGQVLYCAVACMIVGVNPV